MPGGQRQALLAVQPVVGETGPVGLSPANQPPDFRLLFEALPEKYLDNIEVASGPRGQTLRIHPCWLRYAVAQGEFQCRAADEIEA